MTTSPTVAARAGAVVAALDILSCALEVRLFPPTFHFGWLRWGSKAYHVSRRDVWRNSEDSFCVV